MQDFPEEYSDGYVLFCGQRFIVDPRALIPRFETEELVKFAVNILRKNTDIHTVADIGAGSGIIPLSIIHKSDQPLQVCATDLSSDALSLARENAQKLHNESIKFLQGDLLRPLIKHFGKSSPEYILITANLPYVRAVEVTGALHHEPYMAFDGGGRTGFDLYERFFAQLDSWKNRPKNCHVVIEFGLWQRDIAETILQTYGWEYTFFADLRGIERFAYFQL